MLSKLESGHFIVGGNTLKTQIPGFSVILFESNDCARCTAFLPVFKASAGIHQMVKHYVVNCGEPQGRKVVQKSRATSSNIKEIPMIIFYKEGIPRTKYSGPLELQHFSNFLESMINIPQQYPQQFMQSRQPQFQQPPIPQHQQHTPQPQPQQQRMGYANYPTEVENDSSLSIPNEVIPHNTPWTGSYKVMNNMG